LTSYPYVKISTNIRINDEKENIGLAPLASATMLTICMDPTQVTVSFSGIPLGYGLIDADNKYFG
jgi:hypothetical protein